MLFVPFLERDFRNRFSNSFFGGMWALLQPLLQLAVYAFVFGYVFKARIPGADAPGYVPFLVVALWPWTAFAEAVLRSTTVIQDNAALIGKVALPREVLVLASVSTSFLLHGAGFLIAMLVLRMFGVPVDLYWLPPAMALYIPLFALASGFALALSAIQVFVRDLSQALAQLLPLGMFCAPVFYDRELLPERFRAWLDVNPFTFYAESFRALLLDHGAFSLGRLLVAALIAALVLFAGHRLFRRLDPHFEDFL